MVRIDGIRFIGASLWTDLLLEGEADEIAAHMRVSREISDFSGAIQHQGRDFSTGESVERHRTDRAFMANVRPTRRSAQVTARLSSRTMPRALDRSAPGMKGIHSTAPSHPISTG